MQFTGTVAVLTRLGEDATDAEFPPEDFGFKIDLLDPFAVTPLTGVVFLDLEPVPAPMER